MRLRLTGELDLESARLLEERLTALRGLHRPVRLDLSVLSFIDSTGISVLVAAFNAAREDGWRLAIAPALSPAVDRVFALTGVGRVFMAPGTDGR